MNKQLLNSMNRRRMSCPQVVQQLWDAVKVIRYQRQVPNVERIAKYMSRVHSVSEEEVVSQLDYCVRDGLLLITKRKGNKGSKVGVEQEGYKLPDAPPKHDKHDWYCSECHTGGDVIPCGVCHRVYHLSCINNLLGSKQKFKCSVCQASEVDNSLPNIKQSQLNKLLMMVSRVLRDKYGSLINSSEFLQRSITIGAPGAQIDIGSEAWRVSFLIHRPCDIGRMAARAKMAGYENLNEYSSDAATIVHNIVIFQGVHSDLADTARQMLRDCLSEIVQMQTCHTCYQTTGAIKGLPRRKFTAVCRPPHELVYAKEKGSQYWPAKVIKEHDSDKVEVWFFGNPHQRATVDRCNVLPITTSMNSLEITKRTSSWNRACEELKKHQELLKRLEEGTYESSSSSDSEDSEKNEKVSVSEKPKKTSNPVKRQRRKGSDEESSVDDTDADDTPRTSKKEKPVKKRGRPPINKSLDETPPKKKRGRPPKKPAEAVEKKDEIEEKKPDEESQVKDEKEDKTDVILPEVAPGQNDLLKTAMSPISTKNEEEIVSSSCMEPQVRSFGTQTKHDSKKDRANKELIAKLREELDKLKALHAEQIKELKQRHSQEIAIVKKKQWCYNCEQEAIYHCCWNTAYCSTECQQLHWQGEHKRICRRKR
ncbi:zinc finger MYND domain-containing protein 11 [Cimex lectularius]|uniref:Zinc finger MYND domain-containing protein 11 n=1 Tax=Cimex lectularius TaxID=79782 RepID=A0A8I6RSU8_CIMLE|nr:zinc finger MYND domain-containing protein 11 [Cimex lectularius]